MSDYRAYFSHDSQTRSDEKIMSMMLVYGHKGYSWYWCILEMLRDQTGLSIRIDTKSSLLSVVGNINKNVPDDEKITPDILKQFIKDCCNEFLNSNDEGLLSSDKKMLWSESLHRRMQKMKDISAMRSEFGAIGAANRWREKYKNEKVSKNTNENGKNGKSFMAKCVKESKLNKSKLNKRVHAHKKHHSKIAKAIITKEPETTPECNFAFETWNDQTNLIHPQNLLPIHQKRYDKCIERLGGGEEAHKKILLAIRNYGAIIADPNKYFFSYKWSFEEFITREKSIFMFGIPTENCLKNFTKYGKQKNVQTTSKYD
jgi:Domain of unknown function (DUF4373)